MRRFWFSHVVFVNDRGKQELRGRYYLTFAFLLWVGGNWWIRSW